MSWQDTSERLQEPRRFFFDLEAKEGGLFSHWVYLSDLFFYVLSAGDGDVERNAVIQVLRGYEEESEWKLKLRKMALSGP